MSIMFCGYRDWAKEIYRNLSIDVDLIETPSELENALLKKNPDIIFFIGWSWIVEKDIVEKHMCVCLHPSPLPKYRGGSPIQHQIINNESDSAVTMFKMDDRIDRGEILFQESFSLAGDLDEIMTRIVKIGTKGTKEILRSFPNDLKIKPQDNTMASYFRRRNPSMSKISHDDFSKYTAKEIYNKVRALQDPYPNAYVVCKDDTKLFITRAHLDDDK